ncbi:WxcM-like domain-containing protein [Flavobacterium agrisoli]|uniref:WxcM-like domain-containing protein n=1 Tax=Flavobacterium agrisoli TaxID=2793066 RepID=A0A934PQ28_9FLAO|nr:WxcM-like domain-containing protein [Flavobacterium agrisoli]MBK0371260.1 WxcM-like domain-containing protein [Flavobacterium agrisoli]
MFPKIIEGGCYVDQRGSISYVNDFHFSDIERFYLITNSVDNPIRGWHGHKLDAKSFYCIRGSMKIHCVKIDNWEHPSKNLKIETILVSENESKIVQIPPGYANAIESIEKDSKLLSFSTLPLSELANDDIRYDLDYWKVK